MENLENKIEIEEKEIETLEMIERGKRIKYCRENELHLNKSEFGEKIGVRGQYIGLVEDRKSKFSI